MLISLYTQQITSICLTVIASLAIGLTIWQAIVQRRHNRLGVRPYLDFFFSITTGSASIKVKNCGLGPASISSFDMFIEGKSPSQINLHKYQDLNKYLGLDFPVKYSFIKKGTVIPAGAEIHLISFTIEEYKPERTKEIRDAFRKLSFHIKYSSFYKEHLQVSADGTETYGVSE